MIDIFRDITEHQDEYTSIFENRTLKFLRQLHDRFGTVTSCYVFFRGGDFDLSQCTDKFRNEFERNSEWLNFGFHAYDSSTLYGKDQDSNILVDYELTVNELRRITGLECDVVRLHYFAASKSEVLSLANSKILPLKGLLCSDDRRPNYYLSESQNAYIYSHDYLRDDVNGIDFYATDLRAELITSVREKISEFQSHAWDNQLGIITLFTHEWALNFRVRHVIESLCRYAKNHNYEFHFLKRPL